MSLALSLAFVLALAPGARVRARSTSASDLAASSSISSESLIAHPHAKLLAADAEPDAWFGYSTALFGDSIVIGAWIDDDTGTDSGAAYVFSAASGTWSQTAKLHGVDTVALDGFGISVDASDPRVIVGAPFDDDMGNASGSAYVFVRSGSAWVQEAKLVAPDGAALDQFGHAVALDGDTAVVGSFADDDAGESSGSAYVFRRSGSVWTLETKLVASDALAHAEFGGGLALRADELVVGAPNDSHSGSTTGRAYVFTRTGSSWSEMQSLFVSGGLAGGKFGKAIALTSDRLVIGAPGEHIPGVQTGAAYAYIRSGSTWVDDATILAPDGTANDAFGTAVALAGDSLLVGAANDGDGGNFAGSAYLFERRSGAWDFDHKFFPDDVEPLDAFGWSLDFDGTTAIVSSFFDDDGGRSAGSAYVFDVTTRVASFCASDTASTPCPCGNAGVAGHGCAHATNAAGALLDATGRIAPNELEMSCSGLPASAFCFFVGSYHAVPDGAAFGDGLRCIGGKRFRFGGRIASAGVATSSVPTGPQARSAYYQAWYRDGAGAFCSAATFNASNGLRIAW